MGGCLPGVRAEQFVVYTVCKYCRCCRPQDYATAARELVPKQELVDKAEQSLPCRIEDFEKVTPPTRYSHHLPD
jgi:hypothetical protein